MKKEQIKGVAIGKMKRWTITYADDVVLLAKSEKDMKEIFKKFKKFLKRKDLYLSSEKSKVLVFENRIGGGKKRK